MTRLSLVFLPLLTFAACGPGTEEVPPEAPAVPDAVVGTYALYAVDDEPLPGGVGQRDGCAVELSGGRLTLDEDALYKLDVLARTVCEDEDDEANRMDRTTSEGPFVVEGSEIRFSPEVIREEEEPEEEPEEDGPEEKEIPDLFNADVFAGTGVLGDTLLTVQLTDNLTTLTFVKD